MSNNKYISLNVANNGGGGGGGDIDSGAVLSIVNSAITDFSNDLQEGEPIVGMAKQLYSPDGVTSEGAFAYRTTAGDADVSSGLAELRKIKGNTIFPETQYNDSAALERSGEPVTGFTYDIEWGNTERWVDIPATDEWDTLRIQVMRFKATVTGLTSIYENFWVDPNTSGSFSFHYDGEKITRNQSTSAVTDTHLIWGYDNLNGDVVLDEDGYITISITGGTATGYLKHLQGNATIENQQYFTGVNIPNDIPAGESTYTFAIDENNVLGAWTPSLPQALQNMQIDGSDYVPQDGDEITINRSLYKEGRAQFSTPRTFVSVGLNSFNKDADTPISTIIGEGWYAVKGVAGLENGYTIYDENSGITAVGLNSTPDSTGAELLDNVDGALNYIIPTAEKPWIVFQTANADKICVHPKWSGYNDLVYEPYEESKVEGLLSLVTVCPMWSVGNIRNIIDIEGGQLINNIGSEEYSAARVNELLASGYTLGVDFDFDSELIYEVLDTPVVTPITFDGEYKANDFGVEYFLDADGIIPTPVYAETYYMQNLVDKLRRMEGLVHLDSLSGTGAENTLYECNDKLFMWSDEGGTVAEWTDNPSVIGINNGYGIAFSHIPNGQTIFEVKYTYDGDENYRAFKMSGDTLVMCDTGGTVLSACTVGESKEMRTRSNNSSLYWVKVKVEKNWIGFEAVNQVSRNIWDGKVSGGHFVMVDHTNYPYLAATPSSGIAKWNSKGQIIHNESGWSTKNIRYNTTGYGNTTTYITNGTNNGPERVFVPTQGGTSGQLLLSSGGGEPTWSNWIKSVQITSDEYEALVTKDPNTLYLIVDE